MLRFFKVLIISIISLFNTHIIAQNIDSTSLPSYETYTSIDEAKKNPQKVIKLSLKHNKLKEFPKEILQFTNLEELDLSRNKLKELPVEIKNLKNLKVLKLSRNNLTTLPAEIGELENLRVLIVFENKLTAFPKEIGKLSKLELLDAWGNPLYIFPDEMKDLSSLKVLDLRVVEMFQREQDRVQEMLPKTKVFFTQSCNCGH